VVREEERGKGAGGREIGWSRALGGEWACGRKVT